MTFLDLVIDHTGLVPSVAQGFIDRSLHFRHTISEFMESLSMDSEEQKKFCSHLCEEFGVSVILSRELLNRVMHTISLKNDPAYQEYPFDKVVVTPPEGKGTRPENALLSVCIFSDETLSWILDSKGWAVEYVIKVKRP